MTVRKHAIRIQKIVRGTLTRARRLPNALYYVQKHLRELRLTPCVSTNDGRVNSSLDEKAVLDIISAKFPDKIKIPASRMWYDFLLLDSQYGWIPVNIKTTTTNTRDNVGNLAMCVYAYTDEEIRLDGKQTYTNGKMASVLSRKLKAGGYNRNRKRDYYFVVVNKKDPGDVIVNSLKGLSKLTPNINNLPFQICWKHNRQFVYSTAETCVQTFLQCMRTLRISWREKFVESFRDL